MTYMQKAITHKKRDEYIEEAHKHDLQPYLKAIYHISSHILDEKIKCKVLTLLT